MSLIKFTYLMLASMLSIFSASALVQNNTASAQVARPTRVAANCTGLTGGPNGLSTGEKSWDFWMNVDVNDSNRDNLTYQFVAYRADGTIENNKLMDGTSRRIVFENFDTTYTLRGWVRESGQVIDQCPNFTVNIKEPASCTLAPDVAPNSAHDGETSHDILSSYRLNDGKRSEVRHRYVILNARDDVLYDNTSTSENIRYNFPGSGRYEVYATVITGSHRDSCPVAVRNIANVASTASPATQTNNTQTTTNNTAQATTSTQQSTTATTVTTAQQESSAQAEEDTETTTSNTTVTEEEASNTTVAQANVTTQSSEVVRTGTAQPTSLPNTGLNAGSLFGVTSVIGFAIDAVRRRFF